MEAFKLKTPRHKYDYKVNPNMAAAKVVRMVGAGLRVLEIGSGPGSITRLLKGNQCRVTALELDPVAIEKVAEHCDQVFPCDLNDSAWQDSLANNEKFEAVVAGDVLEHLYDPWRVLKSLHPLLTHDGCVVMSLPHVGHNAVIASLIAGDFAYQPWGLLDKTHIRFFGIANIQRLVNDAGFKIVEVDFVVKAPEQTEFARRWRQLSSNARQALATNPFGTVYQVVLKAVPKNAPGKGLQLATQPVSSPIASFFSSGAKGNPVLGYLLSFLSLRTRQRVSKGFERLGIRF